MALYDSVKRLLETESVDVQYLQHTSVFTSSSASEVCGHTPEEGTKSLIVEADGSLVVVTVSTDARIDFSALKKLLGTKKIRMAKGENLFSQLGTEPGGIAPFGYGSEIKICVSQKLFVQSKLYFNPGRNDVTAVISGGDFERVIRQESNSTLMD
ncbi:MAG: YbaK/EbsC family protein [Planctomycetota bacterium]